MHTIHCKFNHANTIGLFIVMLRSQLILHTSNQYIMLACRRLLFLAADLTL